MKVTVCFGDTSVVVPCGDGELLVSELIEKAIVRYRKARGRPHTYWVAVQTLKATDGGILDADDQLCDVADDREQLVAVFDEQGGPLLHHNGGDGTSASSVGTSSPEIFQARDDQEEKGFRPYLRHSSSKNDVIITQSDLDAGSTLIVRRGSEPVLTNVGSTAPQKKPELYSISCSNRWSAIENINELKTPQESEAENESTTSDRQVAPPDSRAFFQERQVGSGAPDDACAREGEPDDVSGSLNTFARDSTRRSLANSAAMWKWLDAQEQQQERYEMQQEDRKEPLGSSDETAQPAPTAASPPSPVDGSRMINLPNSNGPLGIHVVPDFDDNGRDMGLLIQGIEPGGRVYQDGRLKVLDRIVEINHQCLIDVDFPRAQEIFKEALHADALRLRVIGKDAPPLPGKPPPPLPTRDQRISSSGQTDVTTTPKSENTQPYPDAIEEATSNGQAHSPSLPSSSPPLSPKKTPPPLPARHPSTALTNSSHSTKAKIIAPTNTKKIGKKINITLVKGSAGLGFSITTRDNPAGGVPPIYIKKILPTGAAIQDGRLKPGDMLLEVNERDMVGQTQQDAVSLLRDTPMGGTVGMVISRIVVEEDEQPPLPRELPNMLVSQHSSAAHLQSSHDALQPPDKADEILSSNQITPQMFELDIPLNLCEASGLGVSVKGKTSAQAGQRDLGIFIKDIIDGGAAQLDGRLHINDQLIKVNGESLVGVTNMVAMDTLRRAMQKESSSAEVIQLVIARRIARDVRISASDATDLTTVPKDRKHVDKNANKDNYMDLNAALYLGENNEIQSTTHQGLANEHSRQRSADAGYHSNQKQDNINLRQTTSPMKPRPASTLGFHSLSTEQQQKRFSHSNVVQLFNDGAPQPPEWLQLRLENTDLTGDDGTSPTETTGFSREGFGRQSMSEKRKGYVDPRLTEFYQKVKTNREKHHQYYSETWDPRKSKIVYEGKASLKELGPTLGLKKSSSLESLQTAVQEVVQEETENEEGFYRPHNNKGMVRGRGCNESFRAAVDRSYENQQADAMATSGCVAVDEESDAASQLGRTSRGSSFNDGKDDEKKRKKSKKEKAEKAEKENKPGIFSGLFKFGKNRKTVDDRLPSKSSTELHKERLEQHRRDVPPPQEQERIREQQRIVQEKQRQHELNKQREEQLLLQQQQEHLLQQKQLAERQNTPPQQRSESMPQGNSSSSPGSRTDQIQQIRARLQQQHKERNGVYPLDDEQEQTEQRIQKIEQQVPSQQRLLEEQKKHGVIALQARDPSPPPVAARAPRVDPEISHYANLQEIRAHLRYHDYMQQEYRARAPRQQPATPAHPQLQATVSAPHHHHARPPPGVRDPRAFHPPVAVSNHMHGVSSHPQPSVVMPSSHPHHYSDPRLKHSNLIDYSHQSKLHSHSADPRLWEQGYGYGRSLTPGPPVRSITPTPIHPRAQTPINQMSHVTTQQRSTNGAPPQLVGNVQRDHIFTEPHPPDYAHRQNSEYDSTTKNSYTRERKIEPEYQQTAHSYGSLPRQRDLKEKRYYSHGNLQPSLMSSSAQV